MNALTSSDFIAAWTAKAAAAADSHPAMSFNGRLSLPAWLAESACDQAEKVFLEIDTTPIEERDLGQAERLVEASGLAFLEAWGWTMTACGSDNEPWAKLAAERAARSYLDRLDELGLSLHAGGRA